MSDERGLKMAKDNAQTIGQFLGHTGVRDAVHVPIISAKAYQLLEPGQHVLLNEHGLVAACAIEHLSLGVVDPFITGQVQAGSSVWIFVRPGSISTLTHQWTHPKVIDVAEVIPDKEKARVRLQEFAENELGVTLDTMLTAIEACRTDDGDALYSHSYESLCEYDGFWADYELYTGKSDPNKNEGYFYFFTCGGCS